jgi:hypothetical protein
MTLDINDIVEEVMPLVRRIAKPWGVARLELETGLPAVSATAFSCSRIINRSQRHEAMVAAGPSPHAYRSIRASATTMWWSVQNSGAGFRS